MRRQGEGGVPVTKPESGSSGVYFALIVILVLCADTQFKARPGQPHLIETSSISAPWRRTARGQETQECLPTSFLNTENKMSGIVITHVILI